MVEIPIIAHQERKTGIHSDMTCPMVFEVRGLGTILREPGPMARLSYLLKAGSVSIILAL